MALPKELITVTPLSKGLAMVLFILLPFLGFYLGIVYQQQFGQISVSPTQNVVISVSPVEKCTLGLIPRAGYLDRYIVKPGDSLLSIARTQLGDVSRVNELIALNKEEYPSLSLQIPFIEQGWSLYLPPKNVISSSGVLSAVNGEIMRKKDAYWWIKTRGLNSAQGDFPVVIDSKTVFSGIQSLRFGDCVRIIYDAQTFQGAEALVVSKQ